VSESRRPRLRRMHNTRSQTAAALRAVGSAACTLGRSGGGNSGNKADEGQDEVENAGNEDKDATSESEKPEALLCPVLRVMMRDPVLVAGSGNTYERCAIEAYWKQPRPPGALRRDPYTNTELTNHALFTNWDKRREVQGWLGKHPGTTPEVRSHK